MANIQVSALLPVGYDLFNDDTSFIDELATEEVQNVVGGHMYGYGVYGGYRGYGGYYGGYNTCCGWGYC